MSGLIINPYVFGGGGSAPLEFIGVNGYTFSLASGSEVFRPAGTQEGDFLIVVVASNNTTGHDPSLAGGFTEAYQQQRLSRSTQTTFWKFVTDSEPSSYTLTDVANYIKTTIVATYRGVNTTTPLDPYAYLTDTRAYPALTTVADGDWLVRVGSTSGSILSDPTGMTRRHLQEYGTSQEVVLLDMVVDPASTIAQFGSIANNDGVWTSLGLRQS